MDPSYFGVPYDESFARGGTSPHLSYSPSFAAQEEEAGRLGVTFLQLPSPGLNDDDESLPLGNSPLTQPSSDLNISTMQSCDVDNMLNKRQKRERQWPVANSQHEIDQNHNVYINLQHHHNQCTQSMQSNVDSMGRLRGKLNSFSDVESFICSMVSHQDVIANALRNMQRVLHLRTKQDDKHIGLLKAQEVEIQKLKEELAQLRGLREQQLNRMEQQLTRLLDQGPAAQKKVVAAADTNTTCVRRPVVPCAARVPPRPPPVPLYSEIVTPTDSSDAVVADAVVESPESTVSFTPSPSPPPCHQEDDSKQPPPPPPSPVLPCSPPPPPPTPPPSPSPPPVDVTTKRAPSGQSSGNRTPAGRAVKRKYQPSFSRSDKVAASKITRTK